MSAERIYRSSIPLPTLPEKSGWHFVFDNPNGPRDDKTIYIDGLTDRQVKFGELRSLTKRLAYGLVNRAKVGQDDIVLVFSPNHVLYPALVQATQAANICVSLANPSYLVSELVHHIKDSGAKFIVVGRPVFEIGKSAATECGIAESNIFMVEEDPHDKHKSIWSLAGQEELEPRKLSSEEVKKRTAFMCYSSGTTGKAKGVESTHYNVTSVAMQVIASDPGSYTGDEKWLAILPLYHMYGAMFFLFLAPFCGATTVVLPKFEPELWLETIQKYRITNGHIVPPIALFLAKHPIVAKYDVSSVKSWGCGAAPIGNDLIDAVESRTKVGIRCGYGMTETTCVISIALRSNTKQGTVGKLVPGVSAKLVDGELLVRGPNVMKGYHHNPKADTESFTSDGWLRTGDICYFDQDDDMFVIDRVKELIKYKGFQVPPADLEDLLLKNPDVDDAAVVGVYDPDQATEVPRGYVVLSANAKEKAGAGEKIASWVAERVANHKKLRGGVHIVDVIPKSPSGKILRRLLRDQIAAEKSGSGQAKL